MGTECSVEPKESQPPSQPRPSTHGRVPSPARSPVVSSFASSGLRRRRRGSGAHASSQSSRSLMDWGASSESGNSNDCMSVGEKLSLEPILQWLDNIPSSSQLQTIPENEVYSDGERENKEWLRTEGGLDDLNEGRWDAPHYVSALELDSPTFGTAAHQRRSRRKKKNELTNCS